jgi:hypothetical protein
VTTIVATSGDIPALFAANGGMLPLPLADRPIEGRSFVHVKVVVPPVLLVVNEISEVKPPAQTTWLATAFTCGVGLTVTR